jgi:hypothetical protein
MIAAGRQKTPSSRQHPMQSKQDIEAAGEQLQKFPKKNDASFYLAVANLSFSGGDLSTAGSSFEPLKTS